MIARAFSDWDRDARAGVSARRASLLVGIGAGVVVMVLPGGGVSQYSLSRW